MNMNNVVLFNLIKYVPVFGCLAMIIHIVLLLCGIDSFPATWLFGYSELGALMLYLASNVLQFCWIHKAFIIYGTLVQDCITFQRYLGFGYLLGPMRWVMLIIGIILFIELFVKFKIFNKKYD